MKNKDLRCNGSISLKIWVISRKACLAAQRIPITFVAFQLYKGYPLVEESVELVANFLLS